MRDVSLAPDDEATASSSGIWSMDMPLREGENRLVFRVGDDRAQVAAGGPGVVETSCPPGRPSMGGERPISLSISRVRPFDRP